MSDSLEVEYFNLEYTPLPPEAETTSNLYEDHLWIIYGELLRLIDEEQQSPVHSEVILHCLQSDKPEIAELMIESLVIDQKEGENYQNERRVNLELEDKLAIFASAAEKGEMGVLGALGDLRTEAEQEGPVALGKYICEELKLGWNISRNLDELAVISQHSKGAEISADIANAIDALIARLWLADHENPDIDYVKNYAKNIADYTLKKDTMDMISALEGRVKFKSLLTDGRNRRHHRLYGRKIYHSETELSRPMLVCLGEADFLYNEKVGQFNKEHLGELAYDYSRLSPGAKKIFLQSFPKISVGLDMLGGQLLQEWHNDLVSPDARPEPAGYPGNRDRVEYPENIMYLKEFLSARGYNDGKVGAGILNKLSLLSNSDVEAPSNNDDMKAAKILAELDIIKAETDQMATTLMSGDLVDQIRFQLHANKPLDAMFNHVASIQSGAMRLEVMYAIFVLQREHDSSEESSASEMFKKTKETAEACLKNPIDCLTLGQERIQAILEDMSLDHENTNN